ncbi:MAG: glycosyltransferase family 4 protein [Chloroflexi bacterium]|nr:glycosyltransferase family 4 protein [Chloroflexota bacterium]
MITGWHIVTFPVVILASRAALVHVATSSDWTFWESAIYLCCAKLVGRKTILHFLSDFQRFYGSAGSFEKQMIQRTFQFADIVFVLSENVRRTVSTFMPEDRVVTVPSSVDVDSFIDTKAPRETGSEEKIRVLFMGGTSGARKGVSDLGSAIPEVLARCPNVEFILCGTVDVQMAYRRLGTGYQESVRYLGFVDSTTKSHLLSTADVYALPSYSEGMPYGIIEAMAAGLAIVATSVGSIPEIVVDGENGLLIRPGDIDCLAQSLVRLAACPQLLHGMATVNREKVSKFYSKAVAFDLVRKNYDRVLAYHD